MKYFLLSILFFSLLGCKEQVKIYIKDNDTLAYSTKLAMERWHKETKYNFKLYVSKHPRKHIFDRGRIFIVTTKSIAKEKSGFAWGIFKRNFIRIDKRKLRNRTQKSLENLIAHEFGHRFGLEHESHYDNLMYKAADEYTVDLTQKQIKKVLEYLY